MNTLGSVSKKSDANKQLLSGGGRVYVPSQLGGRLRVFSHPFESSQHKNLDDCSGEVRKFLFNGSWDTTF
jgi:hypothetical protein